MNIWPIQVIKITINSVPSALSEDKRGRSSELKIYFQNSSLDSQNKTPFYWWAIHKNEIQLCPHVGFPKLKRNPSEMEEAPTFLKHKSPSSSHDGQCWQLFASWKRSTWQFTPRTHANRSRQVERDAVFSWAGVCVPLEAERVTNAVSGRVCNLST